MFELSWCSSCVAMSTRPRITFDSNGRCNACVWAERKKSLDWDRRLAELESLLEQFRSSDGTYDCLVPVSGGKDGSYVAHSLKHRFGMNPLTVTVSPALPTPIGNANLQNFISAGYDHIAVSPNPNIMRAINKSGLVNVGFPYFGWLVGIETVPMTIAQKFGISLVFYGEDGEVEYGGSNETENKPDVDVSYTMDVYFEGGYESVLAGTTAEISDLSFFQFPRQLVENPKLVQRLNWSYFEDWDPYRNYLIAKEHCGLQEAEESNSGTFTNFAQNDQYIYALHTYLMYLKFGFGRANQDAAIEVRRGAMTREAAIQLVRLYDGAYPEEFEDVYLDYFEMSKKEFRGILSTWINRDLFEEHSSGLVTPKFLPK